MNQQRLKECLRYDADTGLFHWIVKRKGVKKGGLAGSKMSHGYIAICIDGRDYTAHRLAWLYVHGSEPSGYIYHINGDRADNRLANLRGVSQMVNMQTSMRPNQTARLVCAAFLGMRRGESTPPGLRPEDAISALDCMRPQRVRTLHTWMRSDACMRAVSNDQPAQQGRMRRAV